MNPSGADRPRCLHAVSAQVGSTELGNAPAAQFLTRNQLGISLKGTSRRCYLPPVNRKFTSGQERGGRSPRAAGVTADLALTSLPSILRPGTPPCRQPCQRTAEGWQESPGLRDPGSKPLGAARARANKGPGPVFTRAAAATRENGGSPGAGDGPGQGRRKPGRRPLRELGRAGGHSRGWAERLPLRLCVVAVPVLGRRRLGLLAGSPRRGSGARPLRCLPPASAPSDGLPRRRRLRGRTVAQGLPRRPPHCCTRSLGLRLLLRGPAPASPSPSPGSRRISVSPRPRRSPFPARARL